MISIVINESIFNVLIQLNSNLIILLIHLTNIENRQYTFLRYSLNQSFMIVPKIPEKNHLKEKRLILDGGFRGFSPLWAAPLLWA